MTRIEEIAAKHKGYEDTTMPCDTNFLLAQLRDRDEKLAAVKEGIIALKYDIVQQRSIDKWIEEGGLVHRLDRILHPRGE